MTSITIRPAIASDLTFMWEMLFESAFTTDETRASWRSDPRKPPELAKYLDGWGRAGDAGVIAEDPAGILVGAAWYRLFGPRDRGDGIMSEPNVPELAIAVEPRHRGRRIGAELLAALADHARDHRFERLMLSVDPANTRAIRLYERTGFAHVETDDPARGTSLIMRLAL